MQASPLIAPSPQKMATNPNHAYVLTTAAYNEEAHIERMILSILAQTVAPQRWVIVSDGSVDSTDEIIKRYADKNDFICYLRMTRRPGHSFGSKVRALHAASKLLADTQFAFIGNVDADVQLEPTYFEELLEHFDRNPDLGISGGQFFEEQDGEYKNIKTNRVRSVTHAGQLVRCECYEAIGGYAVLEYGGEDWHAEVSARMNGWEVASIPTLKILHQRHTGEAANLIGYLFRQGRMDYSFGSDLAFEVFKCLLRVAEKPLVVGCFARLAGFAWSWISRDKRPVSKEFVEYLRAEQRARISSLLRGKGWTA